jgi:hypothetical protein
VRWPERSGRDELDRSGQPIRHAPTAVLPSEQELLRELWLISHFGWIADATICRALIISRAQEILASGVKDRLVELVNRGWVERRYTDGGTDEPEWRLTDSGRVVLAYRG